MSINSFIDKLDGIPNIKDKDSLIKALRNLDQMIGMSKVKESVIDQLKFLLTSDSMEGHMLHCVISGPPGVGKTQLGIVLSKIWNSLGVLKKPLISQKAQTDTKTELIKENKSLRRSLNHIAIRSSDQQTRIRKLRTRLSNVKSKSRFSNIRKSITVPLLEIHNVNMDIIEDWGQYKIIDENDDTITITSREDYIAKYVGHTGLKTLELLNSNLGKVVFIDEAYSLINGDRDSFGYDALTAINRFMSEHSSDIIIIFAGYKEKLEDIYHAQPGLRRRCTWSFDIDGYTPTELSLIFKDQLLKEKWSVDGDTTKFFEKNKDSFKFYGGDTEKFSFYCKLAYANAKFDDAKLANKVITLKMMEKALLKFKSNQSEHKEKAPPLPMYM